jgi:hypothetical protein
MIILRILAVLLRIYLNTSPIGRKLSKFFLFNNINSSISSIKEAKFIYRLLPSSFNSDTNIIVNKYLTKTKLTFYLFEFTIDETLANIIVFALMDVCIAILISNYTKANDKQTNNKYIEIIYLFNPITCLSCSKLNLSVFYNLINFAYYSSTIFPSYILYIITALTTPQYFFLNTFFLIYNFIQSNGIRHKSVILASLISVVSNILAFQSLWFNYINYYSVKDTQPNLNVHWAMLSSVYI